MVGADEALGGLRRRSEEFACREIERGDIDIIHAGTEAVVVGTSPGEPHGRDSAHIRLDHDLTGPFCTKWKEREST